MKLRLGWCVALAALVLVCPTFAGTVPLVTVTDDEIVLDISFPQPVFEQTEAGVAVRIPGLLVRAERPGAPRLPVAAFQVLLPSGRGVTGVKVEGAPVVRPAGGPLVWGQPPRPIGFPATKVAADPALYSSNAVYPSSPAILGGEGLFRGYRLASLLVSPVQVVPKTGQVYSWSRMTVHLALAPAEGGRSGALPPRGLAPDLAELDGLAVNPQSAWSYGAPRAAFAENEPYMIVTSEALSGAFQRLLDHRAGRGLAGRILTREYIETHYSGRDTAEKIRNAIKEAYQQRGTSFVLLGGDDVDDAGNPIVPIRGVLFDAGGYTYNAAPCDYYFGALDGDWNADGDSIWGEPAEIDFFSEVHIGRATVDTVMEVNRWIDKVIAYEAGLPDERRRDLVFMGESLDASTYGDDSKDVTATLVPLEEFEITRLYDRPGTFSRENVIANLNEGPHLTNHLGHANSSYNMGIYNSDVDALINPTPFFSYSQGCDAGAFDQGFSGNSEAISEHFIFAPHAGFGVVMNSRYGWYEPDSTNGPSQYLDHEFYDALFTENLETLGAANDDSRHDNAALAQSDEYIRWCFLETNLHGDPATPVQVGGSMKFFSHRVIDTDPVHGNGNGEPDPGETIQIAVTLENRSDEVVPGVEVFLSCSTPGVTVLDNWGWYGDVPAGARVENAPPHFTARVEAPCGAYAVFQVEIRHADGKAENGSFTFLVGMREQRVLFHDDFEQAGGWTTATNCQDGGFVRGIPQGTTNGGRPANPGQDATPDPGQYAWVTGNSGVTANDDDVDRGTTTLTSPLLDATGWLDLKVNFKRWLYLYPETTPPVNSMTVDITGDSGATWSNLETAGTSSTPWTAKSFPLAGLVDLGPGIALRVTVREQSGIGSDPIVEGGLDDVVFEGTWAECHPFTPQAVKPPGMVGNTLLADRQGGHVLLTWQTPPADATHDPADHYLVTKAPAWTGPWTGAGETCHPQFTDRDACTSLTSCYYLVTAHNAAGQEIP